MTKLIVFDMAGTTVDEDNVVYKTLQKVIVRGGYDVTLETVLEHGAGKEKLQAIKDIIAVVGDATNIAQQSEEIFQDFLEQLETAYAELDVKTFEGTESLFDYLHQQGVKVALNTGYNRHTATTLLGKLGWQEGKQYDTLVTADDVQLGRPYPDMIFLAMEQLDVEDAADVIKIGDSAIDVEEGKAAKCGMTLGVTTGAQTAEQLKVANPDYIVDSLLYLKELI